MSEVAAVALDPTNTVRGCVARSVSPAPAIAPKKMREVLRIISGPFHLHLLPARQYYDDWR
jgi:hypothetical protein